MPVSRLDESDLCLQCGLCCDGSLFDDVPLSGPEFGNLTELGGRFSAAESTNMAQPCQFLKGKCCTAYQHRPQSCRTYRCCVLSQFSAEELTHEQAQGLIAKALDLQRNAEAHLLPDQALSDARRTWQSDPQFWQALPAESRDRSVKLVMSLAALNLFLDRHFRHQDQRLIRTD